MLWKVILLRVTLIVKSIFHHCCINSNQLTMLAFILSGGTYTQFKPFPGSVQFSHSVVSNSLRPMDCSTPGFRVHQLLEPTQTHVHHVGDAIQPSHPLSSPSPPIFNLSQYQVFSNELVLCIRWPKYWSSSFSINPSNEYSGLISFRMDCFDLLVVQGTLKSLLQHHNLKACLRRSAFLMVQLVAGIYWMSGFLLSSHNLRPEGQVWEFPFTDEGSEMQTGWVIHSRSGACAGVPAKSACLPSSSLT